ncbi:hypothetical protein HY468_02200 [Candidatus Roizmanbacteria bacterium]|nr:hypothetical protein [Candidatus Roizmanbacteria bacterium]
MMTERFLSGLDTVDLCMQLGKFLSTRENPYGALAIKPSEFLRVSELVRTDDVIKKEIGNFIPGYVLYDNHFVVGDVYTAARNLLELGSNEALESLVFDTITRLADNGKILPPLMRVRDTIKEEYWDCMKNPDHSLRGLSDPVDRFNVFGSRLYLLSKLGEASTNAGFGLMAADPSKNSPVIPIFSSPRLTKEWNGVYDWGEMLFENGLALLLRCDVATGMVYKSTTEVEKLLVQIHYYERNYTGWRFEYIKELVNRGLLQEEILTIADLQQ